MPAIEYFVVTQTRQVRVRVATDGSSTAAALAAAEEKFAEADQQHDHTPAVSGGVVVVSTTVERGH